MTHYVVVEYELEVFNDETGEYDYPLIEVEVAIGRERGEDGTLYTIGEITSVDGNYDLQREDEDFIIDEAASGFQWS
jgi:hypothetical protein